MSASRDARDWAELLRGNWESLAGTRYRDFFIASHRGWDRPESWWAQAEFDAAVVLHELDPERQRGLDVLEIGCGVGRLAGVIAPRVHSYTGVDIAPGMVDEARTRWAELENVRFFCGDGLVVPAPAADRRYSLAFAHAVFIHCPREVIRSLIRSVCERLGPGDEFRFQLRADPSDATGIRPLEEAPIDVLPPQLEAGALSVAELQALREIEAATTGRYYMGDAFCFEEVGPFVAAAAPCARSRVLRFGPDDIFVDLVRR